MKKFVLFASVLLSALCAASSSDAIGLKEQSLLSDDTIKLGDIFYDLPRDEDRILGHAPQPGENITLNARTLLRIATALGLPWRPSHSMTHIVLHRDATVVGYDIIEEVIHSALKEKSVYGDYALYIPEKYRKIVLPAHSPANVEITHIEVGAQQKSFSVTLAAPSADNPIQTIHLQGKIQPIIHIPVLTQNIENGRVIGADDIQMISIKERDFSKDMLSSTESLIGMTARRVVVAGRPIRNNDVIAPQIIERGQLLTLSFESSVMNISTQAKALENGAKGDVIRVVNTASNKPLQALVLGENQAQVMIY